MQCTFGRPVVYCTAGIDECRIIWENFCMSFPRSFKIFLLQCTNWCNSSHAAGGKREGDRGEEKMGRGFVFAALLFLPPHPWLVQEQGVGCYKNDFLLCFTKGSAQHASHTHKGCFFSKLFAYGATRHSKMSVLKVGTADRCLNFLRT